MDASQTVIDRSRQKETLVIARSEIDHVKHALKGLHIVSWFPRPFPDGDHSSPYCAIPIVYPPHADETVNGNRRRIKLQKGMLYIQPMSGIDSACWVWGESQHHITLGRPPA
jgi:hypothetical protein